MKYEYHWLMRMEQMNSMYLSKISLHSKTSIETTSCSSLWNINKAHNPARNLVTEKEAIYDRGSN